MPIEVLCLRTIYYLLPKRMHLRNDAPRADIVVPPGRQSSRFRHIFYICMYIGLRSRCQHKIYIYMLILLRLFILYIYIDKQASAIREAD